jgi:hypothetical protein
VKYLTALALAAMVAAPFSFTVPPREKFNQPAAGMLPPAFDDDCTAAGCGSYPYGYPAPIGTHFTQYLCRCMFQTHPQYFPTSDTTTGYSISITQNQLNWINTKLANYTASQVILANLYAHPALPPDYPAANYCIHVVTCGCGYDYKFWPVAIGSGCNTGEVATYLNQATYDGIVSAIHDMTCCQCFIRTLL